MEDATGWPGQLLHQAALYNNTELLICLLEGEENDNVNCQDVMGRTCVYTAVSNNSDECLRALLHVGADPNIPAGKRYNGMTPLHCAVCDDKISAMKLLLSYNADLYLTDESGSTPLSLAKVVGSREAQTLLEEELEKRRLELSRTAESLNEAILAQDTARVKDILRLAGSQRKRVLKIIPSNNIPFLCSATLSSNSDLVSTLLEAGVSPVAHPISAMSPVHYACSGGQNSTLLLLLKKYPEFGNSLTSSHELPIHVAAACGNSEAVRTLLNFSYPENLLHTYEIGQIKYKAPFDVNSLESNGLTALHVACEKGHVEVVKDLLLYSVSAETGNIHDAMTNSLLMECPSLADLETLTPQIQPVNINALSSGDLAPLHLAVKNKHYDVAKLLLKSEADVNVIVRNNSSPISLAIYTLLESDYDMLKILLMHGLEDVDNKALAAAVHHQKTDMLILLLQFRSSRCHNHTINRSDLLRVYSQMFAHERQESKSEDKQTTTPVSLNWQGLKLLNYISEECIIGASLLYNDFLCNQDRDVIFCAVTKVDISDNSFEKVPLILFELSSLCVLNMSKNEISSFPSEEEFSENVKSFVLEEINLQQNHLQYVPSYLFKLPHLAVVNLCKNKLKELPLEIWAAPALVELNVSNNELGNLPFTQWDDVFSKQSNGSRGSLSSSFRFDSSLSGSYVEPEWLAFERRSEITLSDSMAPQDVMDNEVIHINQWSTRVTVLDHDTKSNNTNKGIRKLNLSKNAFTEIPSCLACCAPHLEFLDMSCNALVSVGSLTDLPVNLEELNLSMTGISDLSPWTQTLSSYSEEQPCYGSNYRLMNNNTSRLTPTFHKASSSIGSRESSSSHSILQATYCPHRLHTQLNNLEKLNLSFNKLRSMVLVKPANKDASGSENSSVSSLGLESEDIHNRLLFPHLCELDLSSNQLRSLPPEIGDMIEMKVLSLSKNTHLKELPPKLGLLKKLWKLELELCPLDGTIQDLLKSSRFHVKDVLGFLLSILEESTEYNSMNLMFVGSHKMGKTSLLERMRREGKSTSKATHWRDRVSDKPVPGKKGETLSTVGIDINDLVIERKSKGPVNFRTWDFGGQREYYATHQYFLSPRSLYLVIWNIIEGEKGVESLLQWLINIQARAPGAAVIIVGTHLDVLKDKVTKRNYPPNFEEEMTHLIFKTFIEEKEPDKSGLPWIRDVINLSCKTGENVKRLVDSVYENAFDLHHPKSKCQKLLKQKIPKKYLLLQDIVRELARERILEHKDPVLIKSKYMLCVSNRMIEKEDKTFRDVEELHQATRFLHENGVLFHYEDLPLRDMYFLDPQWLCDQLAKVITVREVNTFAPRGIMQMENLQFLFKSSGFQHHDIQKYITNLLGKFEVALQFDDKNLLLPSLLPKEEGLRLSIIQKSDIRIPVRKPEQKSVTIRHQSSVPSIHEDTFTARRSSITQTTSVGNSNFYIESQSTGTCVNSLEEDYDFILLKMKPSCNPIFSFTRLYFMTYIPCGFWPRLITRVLADSTLHDVIMDLFKLPEELIESSDDIKNLSESNPDWRCWQTGLELLHYGFEMLRVREVFMNSPPGVCDYAECRIKCAIDSEWGFLDIYRSKILEITFPTDSLTFHLSEKSTTSVENDYSTTVLRDDSVAARLIVKIVEHIDNLLQDWYPDLGELRFYQTCEGRYLVTRVVLCPQCLFEEVKRQKNADTSDAWYFLEPNVPEIRAKRIGPDVDEVRRGSVRSMGQTCENDEAEPDRLKEGQSMQYNKLCEEGVIYSFFVERCMLDCLEGLNECCPVHGSVSPAHMIDENGTSRTFYIAPDVVFHDLSSDVLISESDLLVQGEDLGRGTFGDVYAGKLTRKGEGPTIPVAMKILFTLDKQNNLHMGVQARLDRASQAYLIARQEISILENIKHPHTVEFLGLQRNPLCLLLSLAPLGSLDHHLRELNKNGQLLPLFVIKKVTIQISQAIAYLHSKHIIYRDLKSENVLVWALPTSAEARPYSLVDVKIADYGISRAVLPSGAKGFGGTPPFIAPEIIQHAGKDTYTEKVDIFSFGMFLYELLTCRLPLIEINSPNSYICQGGRPTITAQDVNNYPSYMLDVMTTAWSHDPSDRPSASDIVSISSSAQFIHLRDAVSLGPDVDILCGLVIPCKDKFDSLVNIMTSSINGNSDTDLTENLSNHAWLSTSHRTGCSIEVLGFNKWNHCVSSKTVSVSGSNVTAITVVKDYVWCADANGFITIICSKSHKLLRQFALPTNSLSVVYVVGLDYFAQLEKVVAVLQTGHIFILNTQNGNLLNLDIDEYQTETSLCTSQVTFNHQNEVWLGQAGGKIGIWDVNKCILTGQLETCDKDVSNRIFCMFIVSAKLSPSEDLFVWSYSYPGSVVHRWNAATRQKLNKLDLSLIDVTKIPHNVDVSKCQVTAVHVFGSYLYIGTTLGTMLVADALTLSVYNIVNCHTDKDFYIKCILPLVPSNEEKVTERESYGMNAPGILTVGKGYVDLIMARLDQTSKCEVRPEVVPDKKNGEKKAGAADPLVNHTFMLSWHADNWEYY